MLQCVCFGVDGHTGEVVVGWGRCWGVRPVGARAFALLLLQEKAALGPWVERMPSSCGKLSMA